MKIAVCMFGQPRTWKKCYTWIKEMYNGFNVDYFCSMKNYNSNKFDVNSLTMLTDEELKEVSNIYKPKKFFIERKDEFEGIGAYATTMRSLVSVNLLKQKYEKDNNFNYDVCILQRYDSLIGKDKYWLKNFLSKKVPEEFEFYVASDAIYFPPECGKYGVGDIMMFGHNTAVDSISTTLTNHFNTTTDKIIDSHLYSPNVIIREACLANNIKILKYDDIVKGIDPILIREDSDITNIEENWENLSWHWRPFKVK